MTNRFINPRPQYLLNDGSVLPNGLMNYYENDSLIRKDTFSDVNEENKNANPVPLNADGSMPNVFYAGTARTILTFDDGSGEQQRFDVDGVGAFGSGAAFDIWNSIVEYEDGALVEGSDGEYYRSIQNNNTANDPTSSPTFWEQVSFLRTYNANITYALNDGGVVASDGKIYFSLQAANLNNDPTSSPTFWSVTNPFDQDLNTTDDVTFAEIVASTGIKLGGTAAANLLDDYEEGTFTPGIQDNSSNSATLSLATGDYTKVGDYVTCQIRVTLSSKASMNAGEQVRLTGLPFTSRTGRFGHLMVSQATGMVITAGTEVHGIVQAATTHALFREFDSTAGDSTLLVSQLTDTAALIMTIQYHV